MSTVLTGDSLGRAKKHRLQFRSRPKLNCVSSVDERLNGKMRMAHPRVQCNPVIL